MKCALLFVILLISYLSTFGESIYAPDSVTSSTGSYSRNYSYDTAGNRIADGQTNGQTIFMGLSGFAETITQGDTALHFKYGLRGQRYLQTKHNADGNVSKKFYLTGGAVEYQFPTGGGAPKVIVYIKHGSYSPIAKVDVTHTNNLNYEYYLQDHLGSTIKTVDETGSVSKSHYRYDPWGVPVKTNGVSLNQEAIDDSKPGFTGHETLKDAGLYHANGRILDQLTGFISPDRLLNASNLISHNRYAYVLHNPLGATDPTGWQFAEIVGGHMLEAIQAANNRQNLASRYMKINNELIYMRGKISVTEEMTTGNRTKLLKPRAVKSYVFKDKDGKLLTRFKAEPIINKDARYVRSKFDQKFKKIESYLNSEAQVAPGHSPNPPDDTITSIDNLPKKGSMKMNHADFSNSNSSTDMLQTSISTIIEGIDAMPSLSNKAKNATTPSVFENRSVLINPPDEPE